MTLDQRIQMDSLRDQLLALWAVPNHDKELENALLSQMTELLRDNPDDAAVWLGLSHN